MLTLGLLDCLQMLKMLYLSLELGYVLIFIGLEHPNSVVSSEDVVVGLNKGLNCFEARLIQGLP